MLSTCGRRRRLDRDGEPGHHEPLSGPDVGLVVRSHAVESAETVAAMRRAGRRCRRVDDTDRRRTRPLRPLDRTMPREQQHRAEMLMLIRRLPLSLGLRFHDHRSLPVPIRGYHLQTLFTLPWLPYTSFSPPPFSLLPHPHLPSALSQVLLYMPIICAYSCTTSNYKLVGFVTRDDVLPIQLQ